MSEKFYTFLASAIMFSLTVLAGWGLLVILDRVLKVVGV